MDILSNLSIEHIVLEQLAEHIMMPVGVVVEK
jgi:hypothetical protein